MTQLVNTFNIELREAEVCGIRDLAKGMELEVVKIILTSKVFWDFSSRDIALGLTHRYSRLVRGCRYVWMFPFTEEQVEIVWCRSQMTQNEPFMVTVYTTTQEREELQKAFLRDVKAGRADKTLDFDPRSCGNEKSAADLPEEVLRLFNSRTVGKEILEAVITRQARHMAQ